MQHVPYNGVIGSAFSYAYGYLTHLYLLTEDYERAHNTKVLDVENYFEMLIYPANLPEDYVLSTYSLLASLAHRLGREEDAGRWSREYSILKTRTDPMAENELSNMQKTIEENPEQTNEIVDLGKLQSVSPPESPPETNNEGSLRPLPCNGHVFDHEETRSEARSVRGPFCVQPWVAERRSRPCRSRPISPWG